MAHDKITTLTPEQEALMDQVADEYISIALSGDDTVDLEVTQRGLKFCYALADLPSPTSIVVCDGPTHLRREANVGSEGLVDPFGLGFDAGWTAFYDYMRRIGVQYAPEWGFDTWCDFIRRSGVFATVLKSDVAYVCRRPCLVKMNQNGTFHAEGGPALAWRDGYEVYYLDDTIVPKSLVMTPADALDVAQWVVQEQNAQVRAVAVKKIGIERVCKDLHAVSIDKKEIRVESTTHSDLECDGRGCTVMEHWRDTVKSVVYDLLLLDANGRKRPYLKMSNPSVDIYHIEGVDPQCMTVDAALRWRNQTGDPPTVLT